MKTLVLLLSLAALGATASADQFKTITIKHGSKDYEFEIRYPQFSSKSVPASKKINKKISDFLNENGCIEEAEEARATWASDMAPFLYTADGSVVALNKRYVGVRIADQDYCGGAHPNSSTYFPIITTSCAL